ncbi:MAG: DUF2336 domain-containing protein [Alphaproteobacteria bacterium]
MIEYDEAKRLAGDPSPERRARLAARDDIQPEILFFLASDKDPVVRAAAAANDVTPVQVGLDLSRDPDDGVRCSLAERIGRLAPDLDDAALAHVSDIVNQVLETLARDQMGRVRRILAEAIKDSDTVPRSVVKILASDDDVGIAAPVLEFSPLLDDEILVEIIKGSPASGALSAISRRAGLGAPVADAIVAADDEPAITELLSNQGAQIREETLDRLVDRAVDFPDWQEPLVHRPVLSPKAVGQLARFVADALVQDLSRRGDLDADTATLLTREVNDRLDAEDDPWDEETEREPADERALRLLNEGKLDEKLLLDHLGRGERMFVSHGVALLSDLPESVISKAISLASAKGITATAWKAGLSMRTAVQLQLKLVRLPPSKVLRPKDNDDFPMTEDEMVWQIEFLGG